MASSKAKSGINPKPDKAGPPADDSSLDSFFEDGSDGQTPTQPGTIHEKPREPIRVTTSPTPSTQFRGRVVIQDGAAYLTSGGLRVEILPSDDVPHNLESERRKAAKLFSTYHQKDVTVAGIQVGGYLLSAKVSGRVAPLVSEYKGGTKREGFKRVSEAVRECEQDLLQNPNVISVKPGFKFKDGWITSQPAVVVTVRRKQPRNELAKEDLLPIEIGGIPVDVRPASPEELRSHLAGESGALDTESAFIPGWELRGSEAESSALTIETDEYIPPDNASLEPVTGNMAVTCYVSPDRGFPTLREALQTTRDRLTIAMYDFTAPHVLEAVKSALSQSTGGLTLVLDPKVSLPTPNDVHSTKAGDYTEEQVIEDLHNFLGDEWFQYRWAAVKYKDKTSGGIYPSAYHIKVCVIDGRTVQFSSGNWQTSNLPNVDCTGPDSGRTDVLGKYNREWHAIIEHAGLAQTFEKFIQHDFEQASQYQSAPEAAEDLPDLFVPTSLLLDAERGELPTYFAPKRFVFRGRNKLTVKPLLTPDNFAGSVADELEKAESAILFQNQSLSISKYPRAEFVRLVELLQKKQAQGLDVRIIFRSFHSASDRDALTALQDRGFDMKRVKLQKNCHTKGILIDDKVTIVGSHNWTSQGTTENRDASFIFYSSQITAYYKALFEHDWSVLAKAKVMSEDPEMAPLLAEPGASPPPGYVRMRWEHFYTD
ncbi:MAG: hypothetical protein IPK82_24920 [Polyangiaceae bacterium]|nr:hypothetical protein [Polyangiaceae bacterium]